MTTTDQIKLTFHTKTFFELQTPSYTLFIDPVFSHERRGRRVADELRPCDYLLATSMTPWFDDTLDVLEECEATFVASPKLTRFVSDELDLRRNRTLDLEPWERASEEGWRITALPISASLGMERSIAEGASVLRDLSNIMPRDSGRRGSIPLLNQARPVLDFGLSSLTKMLGGLTNLGRTRSLGRMGEMFNLDLESLTGGRPGLAYLFEFEGFASLMHLADGVHIGVEDEDFEDLADVCQPEVLIMHLGGRDVEPYVRAVRILRPRVLCLYRSRDPYAEGRRGQSLPLSTFVGAIQEDAPDCQIKFLRPGDSYELERARETAAPSATPPAAQTPVKPMVSKYTPSTLAKSTTGDK